MLVLSRVVGERIQIKDNETGEVIVVVELVNAKRDVAKLGFTASRSRFMILREEIAPIVPQIKKCEDRNEV